MNVLKLKEFNDDAVVYLYQPEGKGRAGEVIYLFAEGQAKIRKPAGEDSVSYAGMAVHKIEEFVKKKNLPIEYTQAWY
jgi:hypothetical protein